MKLSGDKNQCPTCSLYFNSTKAFDKHRVGDFNVELKPSRYGMRRCMTTDEMQAAGMALSTKGFWITEPFLKYREAA